MPPATKTYKYTCLTMSQRAEDDVPPFCMFFAPAGDILAWSAIQRIEDQGMGFQRLAVPSRIRGVKRFFEQDRRNTIPTAVILTLRVNDSAIKAAGVSGASVLSLKVAKIVKDEDKPGLVIDGQHRLMGINEFSPRTNVPVVALLNPSALETAFQFLVINNKSAKVKPDHLRKLALNYDPEGLKQRLNTARLSLKENFAQVGQVDEEKDSPFYQMIRWPTPSAKDRDIVPAAIETALQEIDDKGLPPLQDDTASLLDFFYAIWNPVKERWTKAWAPMAKSNLLTKVGIVSLTKFFTESLSMMYQWGEIDITEPDEVSARVSKLIEKNLEEDFWLQKWKEGGLDTTSGRQFVVDDLETISTNKRAKKPWFDDLLTINRPDIGDAT